MVFPKTTHAMTWADVETIAVPVLLLGGDADLWVPPAVLRLQASHLPHAEVHVVAEAGHHPYWEQPDVFNRLLLAFLGNRSDGTESRTVTE
jgi:pimeloyl-ACP methyl ester carboxylesterase